jgi:hypothetical protein
VDVCTSQRAIQILFEWPKTPEEDNWEEPVLGTYCESKKDFYVDITVTKNNHE